jgi:hypothetical protein
VKIQLPTKKIRRGFMRTFIYASLFIVAAGMASGCGSSSDTKPSASSAPKGEKALGANEFAVQSGGTDVLKLTAPAGTKSSLEDGYLKLNCPKFYAYVWVVDGAKTVDEAAAQVKTLIVKEFKKFTPDQTTDLTVADSPAKRLVGPGEEADDGDAGKADVIVFKVGDHVFVACDHGESLTDDGQQGLLALVQTARLP